MPISWLMEGRGNRPKKKGFHMLRRLVLGVGLAVAVGCVTTGPASPERLQAAESAINEANSAGASRQEAANSYLQLANQELEEGKKLSNNGYGHRADLKLQCSTEDAKLSNVIARKDSLDREVAESNQKLKALQ